MIEGLLMRRQPGGTLTEISFIIRILIYIFRFDGIRLTIAGISLDQDETFAI